MSDTSSNTYYLSAEERQFFDDNGYLVIKGLIEPSVLDNLRNRFLQIVNKKIPRGRVATIEDLELMKKTDNPEAYVNKINQLNFDEVFAQYTEHPRLLHVLAQLVGPELVSMNSMLINKPPGSPWHPPHQDVFHIPYQPYHNFLTSWTAIDPADVDNGCLFVVPGSHKPNKIHEEEVLPDFVNHLFFTIKDVDQVAPVESRVSLPVQPGDTVILHAMTVHGSWPNSTQKYRKAITCVYGNRHSDFIEVDGTVQEPFKIAFIKEAEKRNIKNVNYKMFWETRKKIMPTRNF